MTIIDVDEYLNDTEQLKDLKRLDTPMTFYYDESGNCRVFQLTDGGVNSEDALRGDFVLAGVAFEGEEPKNDILELWDKLKLQRTVKEVKFKHCYGNSRSFLEFMDKERASIFLSYLLKSDLYVHFASMNNLYYSIVDIIDSLWLQFPQCIPYCDEIKSDFFEFCQVEQDELLALMIRHKYPDIKNQKVFCVTLAEMIDDYNDASEPEGFPLEMLRQMLKFAAKTEGLPLLQNNKPNVLVDDYYGIYLNRCCTFPESQHFFDEESQVQKRFDEITLSRQGKEFCNYRFIDSKDSQLIQLSDMVAGYLRKLFEFLDDALLENIIVIPNELTSVQKENFRITRDLIRKSEEMNELLIMNINSRFNVDCRGALLEYLSD